jgi:transcriptional regulator with XRE-family HTH domain
VREEPFGQVFLTFDHGWTDADAEEESKPSWGGHREIPGEQHVESGPDFLDASEAVQWWRDRGADQIFINLDGSEYLWAGIGPPPEDTMAVFSSDDPRGRYDAALGMAEAGRNRIREERSLQRAQVPISLGENLRRRRERTGLSVEELAARIDVSPSWVGDVETGRTTLEVDHEQWVDIVWATREPWPDDRRHQPKPDDGTVRRYGWVGGEGAGLALAEESVRRWLEDDYG